MRAIFTVPAVILSFTVTAQEWPAKISASTREVLALPEVQRRLGELSAETIGMPPADMARFMKEETERWRSAIRTAGVKPGEL